MAGKADLVNGIVDRVEATGEFDAIVGGSPATAGEFPWQISLAAASDLGPTLDPYGGAQ